MLVAKTHTMASGPREDEVTAEAGFDALPINDTLENPKKPGFVFM